jgi:NitT/TauT family transport system substrate-binding protein
MHLDLTVLIPHHLTRARNLFRHMLAALVLATALLGGATAVRAQTKLVLQLGTSTPTIMTIDLYVADKAGFFKQEGLDVEVRYSPNASQAAQLVANGGADVGRLSYEPLLFGYDKGLRGKVFYSLFTHFMYFAAVPQDSPIKTVADLRGKKIGVTNLGSASIIVLNSMLRQAGLAPGDVTLIPLGVGGLPITMLRSKQIDALMLYESYYSALEAAGLSLRYIYDSAVANFGNTGYFATEKIITQKGDALAHFSRALAEATAFIFANPKAAVRIYWQMNPTAKVGADDDAAMARSLKELEGDLKAIDVANSPTHRYGEINVGAFKNFMNLMVQEGAIAKPVPIGDLVTDQFIAAANDFDADKVRAMARDWK